MSFWKKLLFGILVIYFLIAILLVIVYGWNGIGDFFLGPFRYIADAFKGIARGISKAPESFEAGREAARQGLGS